MSFWLFGLYYIAWTFGIWFVVLAFKGMMK